MASRAVGLKKRVQADSAAKGPSHLSASTHKTTSTPVSKFERKLYKSSQDDADSIDLIRLPQVLKGNLDKENNNASVSGRRCKPTLATTSAKKRGERMKTDPETPQQKTPKSSNGHGPTLSAAAVLSSSRNALARRHRISSSKATAGNDHDISLKKDSPSVAVSGKKSRKQMKMTPGVPSPYHTTPPRRIPVSDFSTACSSPSLRSVPNDMVRNIVRTIESKPSTATNSRTAGTKDSKEGLSSIRKNLSSQLSGVGERKRQRSHFVANLSQTINKDVTPEDFSVTVAVRVRPFSLKEKEKQTKQVVFMHENETTITDGASEHTFTYDFSFDSIENNTGSQVATQVIVYQKLARPLLSAAFNGYNTCLFAYGQTGSGKSYTIMGNNQDAGVTPRFCEEMFGGVKAITGKDSAVQFHIEMSYFEIYNEKIHDLLVSTQLGPDGEKKKQSLRVREHPEHGPYVEGLSTFVVRTFEDIQSWLDVGNQQRVTASTGMNDKSSRSHSVLILNMTRTTVEELEGERHESSRRSRINLVDLAGSERSSSAQTTGQRLKEGGHINKSLLTLGKVICMLSERSKASSRRQSRIFIPYRDSALTWLLKESLGGNSRTAMIATISPADTHMEETLSTLRYAAQARTIVNSVKINEDPNAAIIRDLKSEIAKLRAAHQSQSVDIEEFQATVREVAQLREKLAVAKENEEEADTKWRKKLEESEKRKAEEIGELKRAGVSFKVDNQLPNLVNLNEDPQLSELLLYVIRNGTTRVGRKGGPHECEIQLGGALVCDVHCEIINKNEVVTILPSDPNAKIFINGEMIGKPTTLHHADRIVIAGNHFFRLNHPIEVQRKKNVGGSKEQKKDFEFAKEELIMAQNARMEAEIEQARVRERQEMLKEIELAKKEAQNEITEQKEQYEKVVDTLRSQLEKDESTKRRLEVIQEENLVLQREMGAKRRINEMEVNIEAQKLDIEEKNSAFSMIFAKLEAESQKLMKEIERREQGLNGNKKKQTIFAGNADPGKWSPLRISLLLEEANNISTALKKRTTFSRHDPDVGKVQIKVENVKLEIWTLWSMEKFEEKLEGMREAYNSTKNKEEGDGLNDSDDNLFYDPADTWRETFNTNTVMLSNQRLSGSGDTPTSSKPRQSRRITRRLSSLTIARTSPSLQQSLLQFDQQQHGLLLRKRDDQTVASVCRSAIASMGDMLTDTEDSLIDLFLNALHQLSSTCEHLSDGFYDLREDSAEDSRLFRDEELYVNATMCLRQCFCYVESLQAVIGSDGTHKSALKLIQKIVDSIKKVSGELAKLLQGIELDIGPIVKESLGKIRFLIPNLAKYSGALCLSIKTTVNCLDEDKEQLLPHRIKNAFIQGTDSFLRKTITERLATLRKCSCVNDIACDDRGRFFHSALDLVQSCKDLQQRLSETSLMIRETDLPPQYYQQSLRRSGEMSCVVERLVRKLQEYDSASPDEGVMADWESALQDCAKRIALLSLPQDAVLHNTTKDEVDSNSNSNCNNTCSNISSMVEETVRMCYLVQDNAQDFIDALTIVAAGKEKTALECETQMMAEGTQTPNPSLGLFKNLDISARSTAITNSVKTLLELTDHVG